MSTIECPFCYAILEIHPPDKLHSAFSLAKPRPENYYGKILKRNHKCKEPDCLKSISVYWYSTLEYFARV